MTEFENAISKALSAKGISVASHFIDVMPSASIWPLLRILISVTENCARPSDSVLQVCGVPPMSSTRTPGDGAKRAKNLFMRRRRK
jgi:hypothetical protein